MSNHRTEADYISQVCTLADTNAALRVAIKGALAALSQPATFPADINAAKSFLRAALAKTTGAA